MSTFITCFLCISLVALLFWTKKEDWFGKKEKKPPYKEEEKPAVVTPVITPEPEKRNWGKLVRVALALVGIAFVGYLIYSWKKGYDQSPETILVRTVGRNHPLVAIAGCVSNFRQFNDDGTLYIGPGNGIGVLQIPPKYIQEVLDAEHDPKTVVGSIQAGKMLYRLHGLLPWMADKTELDCISRRLPDFRVFMDVGKVVSDIVPVPERYNFLITKVSGGNLMILSKKGGDFIDYNNTTDLGDNVVQLRFYSGTNDAAVDIKFTRK